MLIMLKSRGSICLTNTKGLLNAPGQNNCFLNSAVQVLWHLDIFRRSFRELSGHACMGRSCIFCALKELFAQLQYSDESALPPDALRRALAETFYDQQRFQLGLMDDAAECFENILMRIHFHISNNESEDTCHAKHCIPHQKFTMTLVEQSICHVCGGTSEPLPFSQMVHYVSTSALCCQAKQLFKDSSIQTIRFGQLLRKAGSMGDIRDCPSHCGERIQIRRTLTNKPEIVSLGLVWDSDHSDIEHIMDVMKTIGTSLSLSDVFHLPADHLISSSVLHLVGVVTYYGKHYSTFFFHTKLRIWIYFDDATVREVGSRWEQVVDKCRKGHYQPLLLLYADPDGGPVPVETAPRLVTMAPGHKLSQPEIRGKDANYHSPLAIGKTHENEIMISENSRNSVNIRRALTPNFDTSRNVISPVMQRRAITPNPNKATYEDYDYLPPKEYSDTNNKNTRNLYHQTLAGNNNYANLMYLDPQQLKHLYHHTDNVPKTALPNPGYQNKSPPSTPNYCIMSPSASPTRTRKGKVVSPALDSYGYVSSNNIDCRRPIPSPVTNSEVRTNLKPLSFTKANELLMKKESLKQQKSKEKMSADGRFQVGLKRDTLQPALSSSGSSHHSLQDITNPADCSNNVDKQFKSLEDLMNSLELKASQEYAQMHSLQNGPVEGSAIPSKEKVNLIDMTNHKILSKVPPNQIHKQYSYEDSDNYIDREKVKSILNLQKLQRQRSFNSQCSSTTSGNRSSNSSLDSFETAVRNAKIIPLTSNGKDKTRYDVFNPAIFAHKYNVGDRNSASSSSSTSMENANYEHLPPRQRYQIIPGKKPTPGYTSQGSKEDTGYSSCDSASISSSNSLSLPNAPLDYTSASYKRLAQIPENIQTGLKPAAPLSGSNGDSVLNYGDRDLKHPFIVQTKAQNHTGYSEIEATDECERLCLEADELIALSRMKEEEKDLPTALTLCNNAAAQARSAMEVSEASAESLIFARMKYNCCVMRAQSLHRRILLRQQDIPPDTHDSKRKEIAETANGQQAKIRIGNAQNSSSEIPWDLLSKHVSNIEAYATLPRRRLPSGKKGSKRSSKKERDYELYQSFLERQKAYNATTTPEALKKSANVERETEKIPSKDVRHRKPLKEEVVRILKARHAEKEAEVIATKGPPPEYKKKDSEKITDEQIIRPIAGPSERKIQSNAKAHKKEHKIVRKLKGTLLSSKNRSLPDLRQSADSSSDFDPKSYSDHHNLRRAISPVECYTGYTSDVEGDLSSVHLRQKTIYNDPYSFKKPTSPPLISNDATDDYRNCSRSKNPANCMPLPEQDLIGSKQETKPKVFSGSWLQELQVKQSEIKTRQKQQVMPADNLHLQLPTDYQFPGYGNQTGNELEESRLRVKDLASQFELMSQKNPLSPESAKYNTLPRKKDGEVDEKFLGKLSKSPKNVTFSDQVELVASADEMAYTQQPHLPAQKIVTQNAAHQLRSNCKTTESQKSPRESRDISFPPPPPDSRDNYTTNVNYCVKKVPCHLCRKKHVLPPALYCTDCNFYMSRFKPKT